MIPSRFYASLFSLELTLIWRHFIIAFSSTELQTKIKSNSLSSDSNSIYIDYSCLHANTWELNTKNHRNDVFHSSTDVTCSHIDELKEMWMMASTGIVSYDIDFTDDMIAVLNNRYKLDVDFVNGKGVSWRECLCFPTS